MLVKLTKNETVAVIVGYLDSVTNRRNETEKASLSLLLHALGCTTTSSSIIFW